MAKSTKQFASNFQRLYFHRLSPSSSPPIPNSRTFFTSRNLSKPTSQNPNGILSQIFSTNPKFSPSKTHFPPGFFSAKPFSTSKLNVGRLGKSPVIQKPLSAAKTVVNRYREAVGLQAEAFCKRNYLVLVGAGGVVVCIALWRVMFGVASTFVGLSEGMAKYGFLALAAAMVSFTGMYFRARFTINPDKIYRIAMTKLNTSAGILEVMGAPLTGTDVRAYVMSGGGPKLKNFKLKLDGKRCFLIFPIRGSERKGLVSVEVKKKKGLYDMRLLAVDIPMTSGPDQRIFLIGDEQEYKVGGGLISELRDPIVKAMAAEKEFDDLDTMEEEEEQRERKEAERQHQEDKENALSSDSPGKSSFAEWGKRLKLL